MFLDWAGLPKHLLDSILEKLESSTDFIRFGAVCLSWYYITQDHQSKRSKMLYHHHVPMLLVPSEQQHTWSIYNVLEDKFLDLKLSLLHNKRFSGSQGWLVVANKDYTVTLHRPCFISKEDHISDANTSIHLPQLFPEVFQDLEEDPQEEEVEEDFTYGYDYHVFKTLITADPLKNPNDCIIVVKYGTFYELACMRYGKDTTWTKIRGERGCGFEDVVHYKNQLYAMDFKSRLWSFDPCNGTLKWLVPARPYDDSYKRYLVESCEELLVVERLIDFSEDARERLTRMFRVCKLDFGSAKWIEIESLGDVALFVGDNSAISVVASNFNRCQSNCIYFTHDEIGHRCRTNVSCDLGVYNLESKSCKFHYNLDPTIFHRMFRRPPIWIVPLPNAH